MWKKISLAFTLVILVGCDNSETPSTSDIKNSILFELNVQEIKYGIASVDYNMTMPSIYTLPLKIRNVKEKINRYSFEYQIHARYIIP